MKHTTMTKMFNRIYIYILQDIVIQIKDTIKGQGI